MGELPFLKNNFFKLKKTVFISLNYISRTVFDGGRKGDLRQP